jgi:hypothetical protein
MGLRQHFSTTIYSRDGSLSAEVLFLPRADVLETVEIKDSESALRSLDSTLVARFQPSDPERALATFFAAVQAGGGVLRTWQQEVAVGQHKSLSPSSDHLGFAHELLKSSRIPFEESPLTGVSLEQLIAKASPTGLGALVGWAVAGNTPFLFIYVPAGIIIVSCAVGIGGGLREGLQARIKKLFTGKR